MRSVVIKDELINFEDQIGDTEDSEEIPSEKRILRTQSYDKSIADLVAMIRSGDLSLNPDYQRNYVWENKKASLLVESILLNVPIPVVYAEEDNENKWNVVDGLQRLNSLYRFFNDEFTLTGLEVLKELNKQKFSQLNSKAQRILKNGIIRVIVILQESHPEIKYDIFMRLNRGSVKLTEQELRNCLYRGSFNNLTKELCSNSQFLEIIGTTEPDKRFSDAEMILRFFAVSDSYNIEQQRLDNYRGSMKNFLNSFLNQKKNTPEDHISLYRQAFNETISKAYLVFGDRAFRRLDIAEKTVPVNRAIMDIVMYSFTKYDSNFLQQNSQKIKQFLKELPKNDDEFLQAITSSTADTKRFKYRLNRWIEKMESLA